MKVYKIIGEPEVKVVYESRYYTVVRATQQIAVGTLGTKRMSTEGIARRSWRDSQDDRGAHIATGRALKALAAKLNGGRVWPRIQKATDLLSNG